jgi:hypothetical protein
MQEGIETPSSPRAALTCSRERVGNDLIQEGIETLRN